MTNLDVLLLDIVSIIPQWASVNMLYQKIFKTDVVFNKSVFANRKLIVIYLIIFSGSLFILDFR